MLGKKTAEYSAETFAYYVSNGLGIPRYLAKGYDLVFWQLRLLVQLKLYCLLVAHLNRWNGRQYLPRWSPCFGFFVCHSGRTHYPTLEKRGAQNIAACESQGEQRELSDHWKSIKTILKKYNRGWRKKDKKIDSNTSFNKRFYILQTQIKSLRKRK